MLKTAGEGLCKDVSIGNQDLEFLARAAINQFIHDMHSIRDRSDVDRKIGKFEGFWETTYRLYSKIFGETEAKDFQKRVLIYHYDKTRNLSGNETFAEVLNYTIGHNLSKDEYDLMIKRHEIANIEQRLVEAEKSVHTP